MPGFTDPLAPAKRAAIMCWVLGGLGLLCGLCLNGVAFLAPLDSFVNQMRASLPPEQLNALGSMDLAKLLKIVYAAMGIGALAISIMLLILGVFVRRGGRGAIIGALVIFIAIELVCLLILLSGLVQAVTVSPVALVAVVIWLAVGAAVGLTIFWLAQALRGGQAAGRQLQPQPYYWPPQQQQAFQQQPAGYGYGYGYGYGQPQQQPDLTGSPQSPGPVPPPGPPAPGPAQDEPPR